jgi:hypothetical protein
MANSQPLGQESQQTGACRRLREMWERKTRERLNPAWDAAFADWLSKFDLPLLIDAMQAVADSAHRENSLLPFPEHKPPNIGDVPKYAAVERAEAAEPGMRDCYLVRGRMRKKFYSSDEDNKVIALLINAMRGGMSASTMHKAIDDSDTVEDCCAALGFDKTEFREIFDRPIKHLVFISENEPEWRLWDAHLCKTTGRGSPMNKHFGWHFPTKVPPIDEAPKRRARQRSKDQR